MSSRVVFAIARAVAPLALCLGCGQASRAEPARAQAIELPPQPCNTAASVIGLTPAATELPVLPAVPSIDVPPAQVGGDFTVAGLVHDFRSRHHRKAVENRPIQVVGYIVATNFAEAPACALHPRGKADPPDCRAPLPSFTLGDSPTSSPEDGFTVLGFAANFALLHDALRLGSKADLADSFFGVDAPLPLPSVGAKVRVSGRFGMAFTKSTTGMSTDPQRGILTFETMETLEPAKTQATLGKKR